MTSATIQNPECCTEQRISSGVTGLDEVLEGGFLPGRAYLVRGGPGTGKTLVGLHFLAEGAARGERTLFITLEEPENQLRRDARAMNFDLTGVTFLDLSPTSDFFTKAQVYDIFTPAEVEQEPTTQKIVEQVETLRPQRVFLEAMTQFRYLSPDAFQFHKQVLSFLRFLMDKGATVLFSSEGSEAAPDEELQFVSDGVIHLDARSPGRGITVMKFRGSDYRSGRHSMRLTDHGIEVYPRLLPERHGREYVTEPISAGIPGLDELLHGGIERGTVTLITGPSGVGKTTLGMCFMKEAASRGERSIIYSFEEAIETLVRRSEAIQIPVREMINRGTLAATHVEPLRYSPDELARMVRQEVEQKRARIVMLDSVAGYRMSLQGEGLADHLHALCSYLRNMGVTVLLINELEMIVGPFRATERGISYLSDNILFLRYVELQSQLCRTVGVLKKRVSGYEQSLRSLEITEQGVKVGPPMRSVRGILSGVPEVRGNGDH